MSSDKKDTSSTAAICCIGATSAALSKTAAAPIERVKLLLQNQFELTRSGKLTTSYKGFTECVKRIYSVEGISSFWRGNTANIVRFFPNQALAFSIRDYMKPLSSIDRDQDGYWSWFAGNFIAGGVAGGLSNLCLYHLEFARTRLATDIKIKGSSSDREFASMVDVYRKTISKEGVAGLYRGFILSSCGVFLYRSMYFGLYDSLKPIVLPRQMQDTFFPCFGLGVMISHTSGLICYPLDTLSRHLMMTAAEPTAYHGGATEALWHMWKFGGVRELFKGSSTNVLRAIVAGGVLAGYDKLQISLSGRKCNDEKDLILAFQPHPNTF